MCQVIIQRASNSFSLRYMSRSSTYSRTYPVRFFSFARLHANACRPRSLRSSAVSRAADAFPPRLRPVACAFFFSGVKCERSEFLLLLTPAPIALSHSHRDTFAGGSLLTHRARGYVSGCVCCHLSPSPLLSSSDHPECCPSTN